MFAKLRILALLEKMAPTALDEEGQTLGPGPLLSSPIRTTRRSGAAAIY